MFLMMAEVLRLCRVSAAIPHSGFWQMLCHHQSHVEWVGLPARSHPAVLLVHGGRGAALFDRSRAARGQSRSRTIWHALWRAVVLILLGVFLRSVGHPQTRWTFEDTLTQIGLGYFFLFLLGLRPVREQWIALSVILVGYWAAFALYPLPAGDFDFASHRRVAGLATTTLAQWLRGALEQEHQSGLGLRCLVAEPLPAGETVCVQRRRVIHAQFHSHAGHDDSGAGCGPRAAE